MLHHLGHHVGLHPDAVVGDGGIGHGHLQGRHRNVVADRGARHARGDTPLFGRPQHPGRLTGNAIVESGQDPRYDSGEPYCFQIAIARHAVVDLAQIFSTPPDRAAPDRLPPQQLAELHRQPAHLLAVRDILAGPSLLVHGHELADVRHQLPQDRRIVLEAALILDRQGVRRLLDAVAGGRGRRPQVDL